MNKAVKIILVAVVGAILIWIFLVPFGKEKTKTYVFEPNWWTRPQTYGIIGCCGNTDYNRMDATNCTVNGKLVFDFYLNNSRFNYQKDIDEAHERGKKYVMAIGLNGVINKWPDEVETLAFKGALSVTYDGKDAIQRGEESVYFFSTNNPLWRETVIKQAKRAVDLGVDGIVVNSPWGSSFYPAYGGSPDFSNASIQGFRIYLKNKYNSQKLLGMGISNISSFNYLTYLHQKGVKEKRAADPSFPSLTPFYNDYMNFQRENAFNFYKQFVKEIKNYARLKGKNNFPVGIKSDGETLIPHTINMLPFSDIAFINLELEEHYQSQGVYKLHSSAKTQAIASPVDMSFGWLEENSKKPEDLIQIKMAEAYANKGAFQDQYMGGLSPNCKGPGIFEENCWLSESINASSVNEINSFYLSHKDFFGIKSKSTAKIAILFSAKPIKGKLSGHWSSFKDVSRALSKSHFQYDVIFSEDSDFSPNSVNLKELQKYKVIILPNNNVMDNNAVSLISDYMKTGGKIVIINEVDSRIGSIKDSFPSRVKYIDDWFLSSQELNSFLNNNINRVVENTFSKKIGIQLWKNSDKIIVHLVNYDFDSVKGAIEKKNIPIEMNLSFLGTPTSVKMISPDFRGEMKLKFNYTASEIEFTVPKLKIWDILIIEK